MRVEVRVRGIDIALRDAVSRVGVNVACDEQAVPAAAGVQRRVAPGAEGNSTGGAVRVEVVVVGDGDDGYRAVRVGRG